MYRGSEGDISRSGMSCTLKYVRNALLACYPHGPLPPISALITTTMGTDQGYTLSAFLLHLSYSNQGLKTGLQVMHRYRTSEPRYTPPLGAPSQGRIALCVFTQINKIQSKGLVSLIDSIIQLLSSSSLFHSYFSHRIRISQIVIETIPKTRTN